MAVNTKVEADQNAPAVTRILAEFVATHPSKGWSDEVEHEAHRTFLNWLGCAVGASQHAAVQAACVLSRSSSRSSGHDRRPSGTGRYCQCRSHQWNFVASF